MNVSKPNGSVKRREFLAGTAVATATMSLVCPAIAWGSRANSVLRLGMIGCGGRGTWIADLFARTGQYQFVACADYFPDRAEAFGERFKIEPVRRRFTTLSGYKRLLDATARRGGDRDAHPTFTPSRPRPLLRRASMSTWPSRWPWTCPGCMTIAEAGKKATARKLVYLIDFQTRANDLYIETLRRVHQGAIGRLDSGVASYPWSASVHDDHAATPEERLRLWYQTRALLWRRDRRAGYSCPRRRHLVCRCRPDQGRRYRQQVHPQVR